MRTAGKDRFLTGVPGYCKQDQSGPGNSKQVSSMHILCSIVALVWARIEQLEGCNRDKRR